MRAFYELALHFHKSSLIQQRPGYWSRSLKNDVKAYIITVCKWLAIVWSPLPLYIYLDGKKFTTQKDRDLPRWILNFVDATDRLARWQLGLYEYEFDLVHRDGIKHQKADALSSLRTEGTDDLPLEDKLSLISVQHVDKRVDTVVTFSALESYSNRTLQPVANSDEIFVILPTITVFIKTQTAGTFFLTAARQLTKVEAKLKLIKTLAIVRRSPIDTALQKHVLLLLRKWVLSLSHHYSLSRHPR